MMSDGLNNSSNLKHFKGVLADFNIIQTLPNDYGYEKIRNPVCIQKWNTASLIMYRIQHL